MPQTPDVPSDADQEQVVPVEPLRELLKQMFVKKGMFAAEAKIGAQRLVEADLRGIHSHGSRAIGRYLAAMDDGKIDPRAQILTERETAAMAVLNGGTGLGHVAATRAMTLAIRKAKEVGTGTVAVKRSQHFGAAAVYAMMAVEAGMIGYCTTSTGPATVAAYGSREAATANSAFAWGVPIRSGPPFVLDMACAAASWGKIESMGMYGQSLPEDWGLDETGESTTDPAAVKTMLPAAGARGYGLAFLSSILAGPLVGARMPIQKTWNVEGDGSEHFFYVIDIEQFVDPEKFHKQVDASTIAIQQLKPADGFNKVRLPGELEFERAQRWTVDGIPMHRRHVAGLVELAKNLSLDVDFA
jgi:LDH2 family malate/lactate/ureidoglycolate dehydrogenase